MTYTILFIIAIAGYCLASGLLATLLRAPRNNERRLLLIAFVSATIAAVAHALYAIDLIQLGGSLNFSLSSMSALISAILVIIYLLGSLAMPIQRLGVLVFPVSALSLIFAGSWSSEAHHVANQGGAFAVHIVISIVAFSLLAIASIQGLLYVLQERQLKHHTKPSLLMVLPPLQTMEQLLFRLVVVGFALLTLSLLSGALFSQQIFGQPFAFKHHTILAIMAWAMFATLLFKRYRNGLRGTQAAIWTICGFLLLQLGYFGTKIVTESLNIQ